MDVGKQQLFYNSSFIRRIPKIFDQEEVYAIIEQLRTCPDYFKNDWGDWMRARDIALVATTYCLGLRPSEAVHLKFEDFDFKHMMVKIRAETNRKHKARLLPVPKKLMEYLNPYLDFPRLRFWKYSPYVFPSQFNDHISSKRFETNIRDRALKPLGLWEPPKKIGSSDFSTFTLRHSRSVQMAKNMIKKFGIIDVYAMANYLGHADLRTLSAYLILAQPDYFDDYLRKVSEIDE